MDELAVGRALTRLSFEIVEKAQDLNNIVLVGIKTRGVPMAKTLADNIESHTGFRLSLGTAAKEIIRREPGGDDIRIECHSETQFHKQVHCSRIE